MMGRVNFQAGDKVLLIDAKSRRYLVTLREGGQFHTHAGVTPQGVVAVLAEDGIVVVATEDVVGAFAAADRVRAAIAVDRVVTPAANDDVRDVGG